MQRTFGLKGVNKMSNIISYNSWENKAPFGAIKINQGVRISVQVNEGYDLLKEEISKDKEGYVIRFKNGFRMKIKGEEYKRLHKILTNISNLPSFSIIVSIMLL